MRALTYALTAGVLGLLFLSCDTSGKEEVITPTLEYSVKSSLPHDVNAFTQGLVIHNGELFESTGQEGSSWIGVVDVASGVADKKVELASNYFGEGITILNNKIYQLTWKNQTGFVYDLKTFQKLASFTYTGEGWGITHDSTNLIMSDGTNRLVYLDTATFKPVKTLEVYDSKGSVPLLNELEFAEGFIYANIWQTNRIARIDPSTGKVMAYLDLTLLRDQAVGRNPSADVLNGIAWHSGTRSFLLTGKYWPLIYVIRIRESTTK